MKQDNVSKEFAGLVGDVWHELKEKDGGWHTCTCGKRLTSDFNFDCHVSSSHPAYTIELIKARIQSVSCDKCEGKGSIEFGRALANGYEHLESCPHCNGYKNSWKEFANYIMTDIDNAPEIFTTPKSLMQKYVSFKEVSL